MRLSKLAFWSIVVLVFAVSVFHYQPVFALREHAGIYNFVSWLMGAIFDIAGLLLLYYFVKFESRWKYFFGITLLGTIYYAHYLYYQTTVFDIAERMIFAGFWPFLIGFLAFAGVQLEENVWGKRAESGEKKAKKKQRKPDSILTFLGAPKKKTQDKSSPEPKSGRAARLTTFATDSKTGHISVFAENMQKISTLSTPTGGGDVLKKEKKNDK